MAKIVRTDKNLSVRSDRIGVQAGLDLASPTGDITALFALVDCLPADR